MPAIPLTIFVTPFADKGAAENASWDCSKAADAVSAANAIFVSTKVQFVVKECKVDTPLDMAPGARENDQRVLDTLSYRRPAGGSVNVFLLNPITKLRSGGLSYLNSDPEAACFVQWYGKTEANARALAHELGHLLSLDHVKVNYSNEAEAAKQIANLMTEGLSTGTKLTAAQISAVRGSKLARKFGT